MKGIILGLAAALSLGGEASAQMVEFDANTLKQGAQSQGMDCISVGLSLEVTATKGGRIRTYSTNASGFSSGIYIGAVIGQVNTTNNKTAPKFGVYRLTFSRPVTAIELTIDAITNHFKPVETLSQFRADGSPAQVSFQPLNNGASFDPGKGVITATARNGDGVITYSAPNNKFMTFEFEHAQHPQNIGFTISNVKATPSPIPCP